MAFIVHFIYGMSSFPLTFTPSFFKMVIFCHHQKNLFVQPLCPSTKGKKIIGFLWVPVGQADWDAAYPACPAVPLAAHGGGRKKDQVTRQAPELLGINGCV